MKKIVNTVIVLVLPVLMALSGFIYYAWVVQKRTRDAAVWIGNTNIIIDKARTVAALDMAYTNSIRDMLLMDKSTLPPLNFSPPDSMLTTLRQLEIMTKNDTPRQKVLIAMRALLLEKIEYNNQILAIAASQPAKAKQLITAPAAAEQRATLLKLFNKLLQVNRTSLLNRVGNDLHYTLYSFWTTIIISVFALILIGGEARFIYQLFRKLKARANRLQKREQSFMRLAEESEHIHYRAGIDGIFTYVSKRAAEITGYSNTELIGQHYSIFLDKEVFENLQAFYWQQIKTGEDYTSLEFEIITRSGTKKWVEQLASLVSDEKGHAKEFQCIVRDIDREKRTDDQVMYLQKRLDAILDLMPSMMFMKDMPGKFLLVNNRFTEIMQVEKNDIIGKTDAELSHYPWAARYAELDQQVIANGGRVKMEDSITVNDKTYHFLITKFPLRNAENEMIGICGIGQDFTEKADYIKAIEYAHQVSKDAVNAQEIFLANMSHEIRTPMNGIIGMTNVLLQQSQLTPSQMDYVAGIKASASLLLVIINEILDFSKIKAGKLHLQNEPFEIYEVIDSALFPLKLQAQQKGLSFFDKIDNVIPHHLLGDEIRVNQVITNLVENAIKFTPDGHIRVKVTLVREEEHTVQLGFEIKDTGIGIAADQHRHIFESFSQTHTNNAREFGGTGLGLAISKELIELQHGFITVESNINEGATFYFELPFTKNHSLPLHKNDSNKLPGSEKVLQGKTILVVEDNDINQQVAFHTLRNAGARADIVSNGKAAIEMLTFKSYNCIIMDIQMPEMDGYKTTRTIRQNGTNTCIIAMTASALKGERERCLAAGMNDYISKPFEPEELYHKILKGMGETVPDFVEKAAASKASVSPANFNAAYILMSGDSDHVKLLLEELLNTIPQKFIEMKQLTAAEKWEPLYMLAHQMKFNLEVVDMHQASNIAYSIERDARLEENTESIPTRIQTIMDIYYQYVHLVRAHIDQC
ncbi:PAS domain S-box-containing protein [Chitinophaga niastensis]|uniref:histidine kinase n=1 Tax=Chitinophaga niastensis TaxID=536980 RepID=A0A2P8HTG1_CHINA|nr:PAS domain S-box protein [Chitinophaga niastensis]PSL49454.1 PAS domain S-box-containing protein [Chitinophaga niastensis]